MSCGCRISLHSKDLNGFSIPTSSKFRFACLIKPQHHNIYDHQQHHQQRPLEIRKTTKATRAATQLMTSCCSSSSFAAAFPFISRLQPRLPRQLHVLANSSFSQKEDDRELASEGLSSITGAIVALGKFDALHIGHRELAIQASKAGVPILLSFAGMAEVLGWAPRAPIVAKCDRERVLSSWAPYCGNVAPKEFLIDFAGVRHLTPRQFVEKLSKALGVGGVVAGENYRFGYKAAGDAAELVRLCDEYGLQAYIINPVMDKNQNFGNPCPPDKKEKGQVSSTRVRYALNKGDMQYVSELLGRQHRLILSAENKEEFVGTKNRFSAPKSCLLNLPPKEGLYENCSLIIREDDQVPCRVLIDSNRIHLESDDKDRPIHDICQGLQHLGIIEFSGGRS